MTSNQFLTLNTNLQISSALLLIAIFLGYIAWKLSQNHKSTSVKRKK